MSSWAGGLHPWVLPGLPGHLASLLASCVLLVSTGTPPAAPTILSTSPVPPLEMALPRQTREGPRWALASLLAPATWARFCLRCHQADDGVEGAMLTDPGDQEIQEGYHPGAPCSLVLKCHLVSSLFILRGTSSPSICLMQSEWNRVR